ncbi:LPS export ABC transporter periplasmic protein LptC [OCS116 cluster bacterium]|nr:LPS export ABC transporter periplasmic protein LptC [OCS116 cluster bacterium]
MNKIRSKNQIDKIKIKRLKLILPIFIFIFILFIIFQYISTKKVFVIDDGDISNYSRLTFDSTSGVIKPLLTGNTSDGSFYKLTANRASPLGPELKDIELEKVNLEFYDKDKLTINLLSNFAKYLASTNSAILFDNLEGKTFDGYSFTANSVSMNLDTSFIFIDGPVIGGKDNINFDAGKIEVYDKGLKIFFSSGIKLKISKPISELKND